MRRLEIRLLAIVAVCGLAAAPAAHAVPLHLHMEGTVLPYYDYPPNDGTVALGIQVGAPVTLDLYFDPAAADSYHTAYSNSETAYYSLSSASFSLTLSVGSIVFTSDNANSPALGEGAVSTYHTIGQSDPFQDYQITSRVGTGAGCSPGCVDVILNFRDDVAPFELYDGKSILQVPDLTQTTALGYEILGAYGAGLINLGVSADSFSLVVVPESKTALLLAAGLVALARRPRRPLG